MLLLALALSLGMHAQVGTTWISFDDGKTHAWTAEDLQCPASEFPTVVEKFQDTIILECEPPDNHWVQIEGGIWMRDERNDANRPHLQNLYETAHDCTVRSYGINAVIDCKEGGSAYIRDVHYELKDQPLASPCTITDTDVFCTQGLVTEVPIPAFYIYGSGGSSEPTKAASTDGFTPIYETVPVTQQRPVCPVGFQLKHFVPAYTPLLTYATGINLVGQEHDAYWEDAKTPNADVNFPDYRCFPDPNTQQ